MDILRYICEIDSNPRLAGTIALVMMIAIIVFCASWLILKKVILNKIYHHDEQFVKEYKKNLKEREEMEGKEESKPNTIEEDF